MRKLMLVLSAVVYFLPGPSQQSVLGNEDSVLEAVKNVFSQVRPILVSRKLDVICIGAFTSPKGTSSGPEIQLKLKQMIEQSGEFKVNPLDYKAVIRGRLEMVTVNSSLRVRLIAQIFNEQDQPIVHVAGQAAEGKADIAGQEAVPRLLGITSHSAGASAMIRSQQLRIDSEQDPSIIKGTEVFAAKESLYSIELLERRAGAALSAFTPQKFGERGWAMAEIPKQKSFSILLRNYSSMDAAVRVSIDSISVSQFSTLNPPQEYFLVPARTAAGPGQSPINGWVIDDKTSAEFTTVDYPESAAHRLKIEPNEFIGQICAQFSQAFPAGEGSRAVAVGDKFDDHKDVVQRSIGNLQATIHVRYER